MGKLLKLGMGLTLTPVVCITSFSLYHYKDTRTHPLLMIQSISRINRIIYSGSQLAFLYLFNKVISK